MRSEVEEYFAAHNIPIDKLVQVGARQGLSPKSVKAAAGLVYDDVQCGKRIKPLRLAWTVFARSSRKPTSQENLDAIQTSLNGLQAKLDEHMMPWYKKLWRWINAQAK